MFKTKLEVDRHVNNCLKKINSELERNHRCFAFAKLYFNVGEYEHARRYISSYLSVKPKSAEGQLWLGKCLEKLGKKEAALEAYRNSLKIDPKQNNLVLKVCELLSSDDVTMDKSGARYFCSMAQNIDPNNPIVYSLKEKLITTENEDPSEVTKLLLKELESRPMDVNLRVRLLKHFLQHNMIKEAYKHASAIEEKSLSFFHKNLNWYETLAEILVRFERDRSLASQLTWEFWFLSVSVLDRLVALTLDEHVDTVKNSTECITAAFNFDQMLSKASQNISTCPDRQLVTLFLNHYHAQLYFHIATLLFKQAKKDLINFKEAANISLPVLLAAYHSSPPDLQSMWLVHSAENTRRLVLHWHKEASFRCSQTGHVLLGAAKDRKSVVLEKAAQYSTGNWRDQLFKKVFVQRDQHLKMSTSYFVSSSTPLEPVIKLPEPSDMLKYDEVAQIMHPDSLHHYVWTAMNNQLSKFDVKTFDGLQYSIRNLNNCAAESLNVLDVQAFIYCATLCAKSRLEDKHQTAIYYNQDRPRVLPAAITDTLGTLNQTKFLTAAYKMYKNENSSDMGELRLVLIKGIEVVRCVGHHGLHVKLLVALANIFDERAKNATKQSETEFNCARAELYWKTALPLLEKIKNNQMIIYPNNRVFEYKSRDMTVAEAAINIDKGKLFTAIQLMKKKDYERALQMFEQLKDPYASFYQSQIYKYMADQKTNQNKENVTSEMRSQNIILLSKARDSLYLTLDRLREPSVDRNHPLNEQLGTEIEKMERLLSRIDPDCNNRNECDGMSDENASSDNSVGEQFLSTYAHTSSFHNGTHYTPKQDTHNHHSTPLRFSIQRQEARPSPERLDAQIRQMAATRDTAIHGVLEQNKILADSHKTLVEELRGFKDAINNLTSVVDDLRTMKRGFEELKDVKKSVDELRHSVDDLQNVVDVVKEMRKELNELRKDQTKQPNQLSDEDLFVLDSDYGVDYNINSNMNAYGANLPNIYPNYPAAAAAAAAGRMPNAANALAAAYGPPGLYPGLYPGLAAYAYGGLGLPQPGTLPFATEPQVPGLTTPIPPGGQVVSSYPPQALMGQPVMNPALSSSTAAASLGVGMLTGQALSSQAAPVSMMMSQPQQQQSVASKPQQAISNSTQPLISSSSSSFSSSSVKAPPPVNVVITNSDPLPTNRTSISQPVLSVTIPPQHIKGSSATNNPPKVQQVHNYQITMPTSAVTGMVSTPSILSKPPPTISTQSLLSNVAPPLFSAINQNKYILKNNSLDGSNNQNETLNSSRDKNLSTSSVEEHDPCPDFKPIIPLPDEVPVNTGEENEKELFCERAKLFRFVITNGNAEWKERGVGVLKILSNPETGKVRILMRRDQVHKICANHFIDKTMNLTPMNNNDRAYMWVAHDFADQVMVVEKLCVRFKTAVEAKSFYDAFETAKKLLDTVKSSASQTKTNQTSTPKEVKPAKEVNALTPKTTGGHTTTLGGFVFTSTPTFKPKETEAVTAVPLAVEQETSKTGSVGSSPFSSLSFGPKTTSMSPNLFKPTAIIPEVQTFSPLVISQQKVDSTQNDDDSHTDDFVPTAEFKPVVALPDLVEVKTGEENSEVLFENRAKLFRYDQSGETKEWKERGVGIIKILKDDTIRLLMRRDQVHKVCCNHQVLKNMTFKFNATNPKAIVWSCKDFSEGVLTPEMFTVRFKTEEQASQFLQIVQSAQTSLDENNKISNSKHHKPETRPRTTSFGDKFKPAKGSWECKTCYISNDGKSSTCVACDTPKTGTTGKKSEESGALFSFGTQKIGDAATPNTSFVFGKSAASTAFQWGSGAGNAFIKPADSSSTIAANNNASKQVIDLSTTPAQTFKFGVSSSSVSSSDAVQTTEPAVAKGFGDAFKPKAGTWECNACLIRNDAEKLYCISCESPKDDTVPKKESNNKGVNLDTPGLKFTFGIPPAPASTKPSTAVTLSAPPQVTFSPSVDSVKLPTPASQLFTFKSEPSSATNVVSVDDSKFVFGSPQKHDFEFKPRSPRRASAGGQGDEGGAESDGSYVEEEEEDNIYFKPVIPLPDKVEVVTGEENEDVLYCHRAKLFRFIGGEWKERGLGDLKILRNKSNGKLRVLMRREHVLKICLNHVLSSNIEYLPKDEKSWLFHAADYSDGELAHEQFSLRFKNAEIAGDFKNAVDKALASEAAGGDQATCANFVLGNKQQQTTSNKKADSDDDDVILVSETKVSAEDEKEALRLKLPPKFLAYKQLPDCTCEQCKKDDEYLKELFADGNKKPFSIFSSSTGVGSMDTNSSGRQIFGTPLGGTTTGNNTSSSTTSSVFASPMGGIFGQTTTPSTDKTKANNAKEGATAGGLLKPPTFTTPEAATTTPISKPFTFAIGQQATASIFSPAATTPQTATTATSSIFSSTASSLFDNTKTASSPAAPPGGLFGKPLGTTTANIFGATNTSNTSTSLFDTKTNLFGATPATPPQQKIFGVQSTTLEAAKTTQQPLFGVNSAVSSTGSIFGVTNANKAPVSSTGSIFEGSYAAAAGTPVVSSSATTLFGNTNNTPVVSAASSNTSIFTFGDKQPSLPKWGLAPENTASSTTTTANLKDSDEVVLKVSSSAVSFADLAKTTTPNAKPAFGKTGDGSFAFLGAGAPVFGSLTKSTTPKSSKTDKNKSQNESDDENTSNVQVEGGEEEYDPHYEPIVPLPDAIVVSTGEEEEEPLFNERAKLFRFDANTKEWKERGVGQMKVLHHKDNNTYRFLLRREQVHKIVLNQLIVPTLEIQPMMSSDKAWMWAGYNYTDDENNLEKLAIRFKNVELAQRFHQVVTDVVNMVIKIQNDRLLIPAGVQNYGIEDISDEHENEEGECDDYNEDEDDDNGEHHEHHGDSEDDDEEYDDERCVMFSKRCTLSELRSEDDWHNVCMGDLQVYYDPDSFAAKIAITDDHGTCHSETLIAINTVMDVNKTQCRWKAVEWADGSVLGWRDLRATFSSEQAAQEFHLTYLEGLNYAQQSNIMDELPAANEVETED